MAESGPSPAELVRQLRIRYGSHDKLADAVGTSRQTVIRWEKGLGPGADYAARLADLDGEHTAEEFMPAPTRTQLHTATLEARLGRIEASLEMIAGVVGVNQAERVAIAHELAEQLRLQSALLLDLVAVAEELKRTSESLESRAAQ